MRLIDYSKKFLKYKLSYSKDASCNIGRNSAAPMHLVKSKIGMSGAYSRLGNKSFLSICCPSIYWARTQHMLSTNGFVTATGKFNMDLTVSLISCGCASVDAYKFKCPYTDHNNYEELYNLDEVFKNILILSESSLEEVELDSTM